MSYSTRPEPFELSMLGGTIERRYNQQRAKLDFPWGSLAEAKLPPELLEDARAVWTRLAFVEYRSAAGMNAVTETMIAARAPLDLTAVASGFASDELSHAEMCARVLAELGGSEPLIHRSCDLIWQKPSMRMAPLMRAADIVVRVFCVAEAFALPMAQTTARLSAEMPLVGEVLHRIAKDEAAHASFGWIFMDWASQWLTDKQREHLTRAAQETIDAYRELVSDRSDHHSATLGWLSDHDFRAFGEQALANDVCEPLRARGIMVN
jgi:hypothetical protein